MVTYWINSKNPHGCSNHVTGHSLRLNLKRGALSAKPLSVGVTPKIDHFTAGGIGIAADSSFKVSNLALRYICRATDNQRWARRIASAT